MGLNSVQRIYLNTYSDGLYTNYEVDDIVIVDLAYVYDGEYFHPQIHDIEWTSVGGKHNENEGIMPGIINEFRSWLDDKFGWLKYPIIITIGIIALAFVVRIFGITMVELWELIKSIIKYAGPVIIFGFSLFTVYAMLTWTRRIKTAWGEIWKNPILIIFVIALTVIGIMLFSKHVIPLLP